MGIEGSITINVTLKQYGHNAVGIQSTRPVHACRVFHGKTVNESLKMLPLLFNICGVAQVCAGVRASEQALAIQVSTTTELLRDALVKMETLREHLWRLLLEWPLFLQLPVEKAGMTEMLALQRHYQQLVDPDHTLFNTGDSVPQSDLSQLNTVLPALRDLLQHIVFAMPAEQWLTLNSLEQLTHWAETKQTIAAQLFRQVLMQGWSDSGVCQLNALPTLERVQLDRAMADVNFVKQPQWLDRCCETSSLTRVESPLLNTLKHDFGNGLLARLTARLTEIAQISMQLAENDVNNMGKLHWQSTENLPHNPGIGQVAAARGQLIHRVSINNDRIEQYQILAPTEWNFHPEGVVIQALASLSGNSVMIEQQARLLINAIDPCVAYQLHITG